MTGNQKTFESLDGLERNVLTNSLFLSGEPYAGDILVIDIPLHLYVYYRCTDGHRFKARIIREDIKGCNRYPTCPSCRQSSTVVSIGSDDEEEFRATKDVFTF